MNLSQTSPKMSGHPLIIQGGMGIGVSNWKLARAVSLTGQLGVVSGTALDTVMIRRLQDGDADGAIRRALAQFPNPDIALEIFEHYYLKEGRKPNEPYQLLPIPCEVNNPLRDKVGVVAGFVEVFLAKEGHNGLVGMNLLTKIQHSHLAILYGAMLAGVDYILMGAGIPKEIPALLDQLALNQTVRVKLDVEESKSSHGEEVFITFAPDLIFPDNAPPIQRPYFFPIVSSHSLAMMLSRKSSGKVDGFIVEGHQAGGHNAPPRGGIVLENGEVQYGARDKVDLEVMQSLGLPFWLAGGMASPSLLKLALKVGASGIQVGTLFALSEESGFMPQIKESLMKSILQDTWTVITDPYASPTGFPFKIVSVPGSLSESKIYETRSRRCGLGYLRAAYRQEDGTIGFRCPGESITGFIQKGGSKEKAINCKCLCNSLLAAVGLPQQRDGGSLEPPIITGGGEARQLKQFLATLPSLHFQTVKAINYLLQDITWCFTI